MRISLNCSNCGKKYNIDKGKIPQGAKSAKCKCGTAIPLKWDVAPVSFATSCPKCGYVRQSKQNECPECGIIYDRYELFLKKKQQVFENRGEECEESKEHSFIKKIFAAPFKHYSEKRERQRFFQEFQELLRDYLSDGVLTDNEMDCLRKCCAAGGVDIKDALECSRSDIETFLHGMLTDIVSDGTITIKEDAALKSVCDFLSPSPTILTEIKETLERVKFIEVVRSGNVRPVLNHNIVMPIDEVVWHVHRNAHLIKKLSRSITCHSGEMYITSERVIFKSLDHPADIPLKKIVEIEGDGCNFYVIGKTKNSTFQFQVADGKLLEAYAEQALSKFYRKLNLKNTATSSRVIQQSVKQAVWIRDQGRCIECGSLQYLEFDHIIPFSKGGSNSENNIQLLCRKCNLAKSNKL